MRARPCRPPVRRSRPPVSRSVSWSMKPEVEACVVRDEHRVAGELEEAPYRDARMRLTAQLRVVEGP